MNDTAYTLCDDCAIDQNLKEFIASHGRPGSCTLCGGAQEFVVRANALVDLFKAVVRYHYREFAYNDHWGGEPLWKLFEKPNPILRSHDLPPYTYDPATGEESLDLSLFIDDLTTPVYPNSEDDGVYLYWGRDSDGHRSLYPRSLREMQSRELNKLAEQLRSTNYYALEFEWRTRLAPYVDRISQTLPPGQEFYRARIGVRDEAIKLADAFSEDPEMDIVFPYTDKAIGAPPNTSVTGGRLNRAHIVFLYMADTLETAVAEVRPHPGHFVSVGRFRSEQALKVANLAGVRLLPFSRTERDLEAFVLFRNIEHSFAMPVLPDDPAGYLLTQFIADMLRKLDFDAVTFRSSVTAGVNFVSFEPGSFAYVPRSGDVRRVRSLAYALDSIPFELERATGPDAYYYPKTRAR